MVMDKLKLKVQAAVIAIFLVGFGGGALATHFYYTKVIAQGPTKSPPDRNEIIKDYDKRLNLTAPQREQIGQILDETGDQYKRLRAQTRPQFDGIRETARARIRATLTPDQQLKFDEYMRERDAQRQQKHKND